MFNRRIIHTSIVIHNTFINVYRFNSYKTIIITCITFLLLSNAVTTRRDKSILYSRNTIIILMYSAYVAFNTLNFSFFAGGIGLFGGLFHATPITQIFHIFMFVISAVIVQLTAFYPRKL